MDTLSGVQTAFRLTSETVALKKPDDGADIEVSPLQKVDNTPQDARFTLNEAKSTEGDDQRVTQVNELIESLESNDAVNGFGIRFEYSQEQNQSVIKVVDSESGEMIKQIPSEELVAAQKKLQEASEQLVNVKGLVLDKQI